MTIPSLSEQPSPAPRSRWHGWLPLALTAALSSPLIALICWSQRDPGLAPMPESSDVKMVRAPRIPPLPPNVARERFGPLRIVADDYENVPVVRIRAKDDGDELIIDAKTGKLLAVRDHQGRTVRMPMGDTGPIIKAS